MAVRPKEQKRNPEFETVWPAMLTFPSNLKCSFLLFKLLFLVSYCAFVMHHTCTTAFFLSRRTLGLQNPMTLSSGDACGKNWSWSLSTLSHFHKVPKTQFMLALCYWQNTILPKHFFSIAPMSFGYAESNFIELHENFSRNNTSQLILLASST